MISRMDYKFNIELSVQVGVCVGGRIQRHMKLVVQVALQVTECTDDDSSVEVFDPCRSRNGSPVCIIPGWI